MNPLIDAEQLALLPQQEFRLRDKSRMWGHEVSRTSRWLTAGQDPNISPIAASFADLTHARIPERDGRNARLLQVAADLVGTGDDGKEESRKAMLLDWRLHVYVPFWLDQMDDSLAADVLRSQPPIGSPDALEKNGYIVKVIVDRMPRNSMGLPPEHWAPYRCVSESIKPTNWASLKDRWWFFPAIDAFEYTEPDMLSLADDALLLLEAMVTLR